MTGYTPNSRLPDAVEAKLWMLDRSGIENRHDCENPVDMAYKKRLQDQVQCVTK